MATSTYLSIINLNVSGLNAPIKKTQGDRMDKKARPIHMLPTRDSFHNAGHIQIGSEGMEKHLSCNQK